MGVIDTVNRNKYSGQVVKVFFMISFPFLKTLKKGAIMATRISGLLLCVAGSFVVSAASAQDVTKIHNFSAAAEVSDYKYKEPGLMKYTGTMYGVTVEYLNNGGVGHIKRTIPVQLRARVNYMQGKLKYDGAYWSGEPLKFSGEKQYFVDTIFAGGLEARVSEKFSVSPYMGLGYRYLLDQGNGHPDAYKREQTYYYLPIGADLKISPATTWRVSFNTEFDILLRGENRSDGHKFRQNSGYGLRASAKVEKNLQSVGIFVEPFYRYWNISKSDSKYGYDGGVWYSIYEPKNNTQELGLRVGVTF